MLENHLHVAETGGARGLVIEARRVSGALGAEISGVDLSRPLSPEEFGELKRLWLEHLVIFFRDQALTEEQYMAFAGQFGEPVEYPFVKGLEGYPKIIEVKKLEHERVAFGGIWHYRHRLPRAPADGLDAARARGAALRRRHAVREHVSRV